MSSLPAAPAAVADYLTDRATAAKTATVRLSAAAIGAAHHRAAGAPDPTATPIVRAAVRGIARQHAAHPDAAPRQAAALAYDDAIRLMALAERPQPTGRGVESADRAADRARLDAAIVALLLCAGLRRSEVSDLRWADVEPTAVAGQVRVRVRTSKTNPTAEREDYRLTVNGFARALAALRSATDPQPTDRVVPLSPHQVNRQAPRQAGRPRWRQRPQRTPGHGVRARAPGSLNYGRATGGRMAGPADGGALRLSRQRRGCPGRC